ncbi:MAG TPA: DUF2339 domain-containing protein [Puia sp.]|nr:DUF2339 domain-containing protein [Puia sp.]
MEVLVIFFFSLLAVLILSFRATALRRIDRLEEEIGQLRRELGRYAIPERSRTEEKVIPTPAASLKEATAGPTVAPEPVAEELVAVASVSAEPVTMEPVRPMQPPETVRPVENAPPSPGFFDRHPDLEKFIGENLVSKIGIAVLVLAIGFFVKYAIDNDWIGPIGRVGIGLLCGAILIGLAHLLRNNYKAFSSVLVGGGLAVFYFTIALAYHQYHLFSQALAFIIMLVITAFAVALSLLYDRQELAIIALAGGFLTPFLVSNGSGNYKILFSYLLILNSGLLAIAYRKAWRLLNLLAFGFTALLFTSWLVTLPYDATISTYEGGFLFVTAFFILFFIINIAHNIKENKKFIGSDFGILLANTCLYFAAGLYLITEAGMTKYRGLFSAGMGAFNLITSYFLFRKKKVDSNILYLLIGITFSFISLTAPLQLHGHYITLFWASESVLLYWLYLKSQIRIIGAAAALIWMAMLISLLMDWVSVYGHDAASLPIVFNKGFMTTLYSALCCYALFLLRKKPDAPKVVRSDGVARHAAPVAGVLILLIGGALEIHYQFNFYYPGTDLFILYLALYGYALAFLTTMAGNRRKWFREDTYPGGLLLLCLIVYLILIPESFSIQSDMLESARYHAHFIAHWGGDGLVALMIVILTGWLKSGKLKAAAAHPATPWLLCVVVVTFLSAEIHLLVNDLFFDKQHSLSGIQRVYHKTGLPILWGLCSFAFMWLGMHYKFKPLRIISLVLFSITLLKLFLFDIRNIPVAGKIAAFFCLGVLLLVVSFMYQRLKKIIIEDAEKTTV